jgi:pimeloyl-ACP methyl ester carboxylesterase
MLLSREWTPFTDTMTQRRVVTDDGVELLVQSFGEGPVVLFGNGIGVRYPGARRIVEALRDRFRVVCWDYRGMGQSVMPAPLTMDISMPRHARDALAVLDDLGVERVLWVGWSMGVQVGLEAIRLAPERVAGLAALFGTYARPFQTGLPAPIGGLVEGLFRFLGTHPRVAQGALDLAVALPDLAFLLLSSASFVGPDVDRMVFDANVRSVAGVEKRLYMRTMLALAEHDASDVLERVSCPTLVVCAERDYLTPPRVARHMAERIPGAEYHEVGGGTHFALIEQTALVSSWLRAFALAVPLGSATADAPAPR